MVSAGASWERVRRDEGLRPRGTASAPRRPRHVAYAQCIQRARRQRRVAPMETTQTRQRCIGPGNAMAPQGRRHDLHLTSSGVGLHYTPRRYFPPARFASLLKDPLPPKLRELSANHPYDEVFNCYETTSGSAHNLKTIGGILSHPRHVKVPSLRNVHYMKDVMEKLSRRDWKTPLNMANQTSEMKDKYTGRLPPSMDTAFKAGPQPFPLANHLNNGPSKNIVASTEYTALAGREYYLRDKDTLPLNDIYLSTTSKDFRSFKKEEFPKKDFATYWQTEDNLKAQGHGLKENLLPKGGQQIFRDSRPMTDPTVFSVSTRIPRLPKRLPPVPNRGLKTLFQESYQPPSNVKWTQDVFCPLRVPWEGTKEAPIAEILSVPQMYKTGNMMYGSKQPVIMNQCTRALSCRFTSMCARTRRSDTRPSGYQAALRAQTPPTPILWQSAANATFAKWVTLTARGRASSPTSAPGECCCDSAPLHQCPPASFVPLSGLLHSTCL
ncbi:stabilizer of axonemal microtubules 3-like isoform X2 [Narcine bancroftii]|uniref:stabilizer of axonemal microtubules 3-like isoform X2 n=1 Tax=Narcine bancroftii TaxID=1343680 RepID=UPI003831B871